MAKEICKTLEEAKEKWPPYQGVKSKIKVGDEFGRLKTIYKYRNNKKSYWICQCNCAEHNYIKTTANHLITGHTTSCGCYSREICSENGKKLGAKYGGANFDNIAGQKFGKLTALEPTDKRNGKNVIWKCSCECSGIIIEVPQGHLVSGHTQSCGCIKSIGEYTIAKILNENNIPFNKEKTFDTCLSIKDNTTPYYFDFYIDNKYIIEYDGKQHFEATFGWNDEKNFQNNVEKDNYKNQWCKENNIPLIRIPYTRLKDLCLEDLLLETTTFLV